MRISDWSSDVCSSDLGTGFFNVDEPNRYQAIFDALFNKGDYYMLLADYESYVATQKAVGQLYKDQEEWSRRAILNVSRIGKFSSDRTIRQYAEKIWKIDRKSTRLNSSH